MVSFGLRSDFRVGLCVISQRTKNISYWSFCKSRKMNNNVISFLFTWHLSGCMENTVSGFVPWGARMLTYTVNWAKGHQDIWGSSTRCIKRCWGKEVCLALGREKNCWGPVRPEACQYLWEGCWEDEARLLLRRVVAEQYNGHELEQGMFTQIIRKSFPPQRQSDFGADTLKCCTVSILGGFKDLSG